MIVLYGAIVHGKQSVLAEYNADPNGVARELGKVVMEQISLTDDKKVSFCSHVQFLLGVAANFVLQNYISTAELSPRKLFDTLHY